MKADELTKEMFREILEDGCLDKNPRPHYEDNYITPKYTVEKNTVMYFIQDRDGNFTVQSKIKLKENQTVHETKDGFSIWTPAHTLSVNHKMFSYDLSKGEFPLITLRPIAVKNSIAELLWIYIYQSNDLVIFDDLIGKPSTKDENGNWIINNWWRDWAIKDADGNYVLNEAGHPTIGCCYGETVRRHNLMNDLINAIKNDPDGRRHIINMWQVDDFKNPHGLKPCAYQTVWNVRHGKDGVDYLDMCLFQRSSDFATAGCINQVQYAIFLQLMANYLGYKAGKFTWMVDNIQIYDRHIEQCKEMLKRESIECSPSVWINPEKDIFKMTPEDIKIIGYPRNEIKAKNPQFSFPLGI